MVQTYITSEAGIAHLRQRCENARRMASPHLIYQVLARGACAPSWQITAPPTRDPWLARRRLHEAHRYAAVAVLAMASTSHGLAQLVWRLQREEPACAFAAYVGDNIADSADGALARPLDERAFLDVRRWHLEQGPGGDHDQPYSFMLPAEGHVVLAWVRLLARARRSHRGRTLTAPRPRAMLRPANEIEHGVTRDEYA